MEDYNLFLHSHTLFWFIAIVLFMLTIVFIKLGRTRMAKMAQMILRLIYVLVLMTGVGLIFMNIWWGSILKGIISFWLIYVMELITNRMAKGQLTPKMKVIFAVQFIVVIIAVFYLGYNISE